MGQIRTWLGHTFGKPKPKQKSEGLDFALTNNVLHDEYIFMQGTTRQRKAKACSRWMVLGISAASVSIMFFGMRAASETIADIRTERLANYLKDDDYIMAFAVHFLAMIALVSAATFLVLVEPAAGGGGIPEVIAFLNGVNPPRSFDLLTVFCKMFGTIFAVASGLAIGPEGPTIHLGAALSLNIAKGFEWVFHKFFPKTAISFQNDSDRRLFMAGGAAAGIACAFRAPIGGLVFALEEAISHFDGDLIVRIYFMCMTSYYVLMVMMQGQELSTDDFTEYDLTGDCEGGYAATDIFWFAVMGVVGGLLGGFFNFVNMKINVFRQKYVNTGWKRWLEMLGLVIITSMLVVFPPISTSCTPSERLVDHLPGVETLEHLRELTHARNETTAYGYCLSSPVRRFGDAPGLPPTEEEVEALFEKKFLLNRLCEDKTYYNELESLLQGSGHNSVALLFEEGGNDTLSAKAVITFMAIYFFLAVITAGSSVPAGLVIPTLIIGGCMGRLFAIFVDTYIKANQHLHPVDPGAWAQVGAAAFWCGSGRITATIAIITLEITGDYTILPAIGVTVLFAKWTGDLLNHGLYHQLIHLKGLDYLGQIPKGQTKGASVKDIMTENVLTLLSTEKSSVIRKTFESTHQGFPVLAEDGSFVGIVLRKYLAMDLDGDKDIDVAVFMDPTPHQIRAEVPAWQAMKMFVLLGLRHLPVVDKNSRVVGILTRENFHHLEHWHHDKHGTATPMEEISLATNESYSPNPASSEA
eukprot:m.49386 g.49386  ORF g.49386 m.49386 type:complete len:753 (-) comp21010_c0_seq2:42-2300(-)